MKKRVIRIGLFSMILIGMVSCKNKEKEMSDKKNMALESFVDSVKTANAEEIQSNWDEVSADFDRKSMEANDALVNLKEDEKENSQAKVTAANLKYNDLKMSVQAKLEADKVVAKPNPSQLLRDRLFGAGKIGNDMNFAWVNKDNILKTYDTFFQSYKENKSNFSREDYDEIKLMYEALDNRKNTVENEGLTTEDNNKIASIKFKFGPMFKMNRMGAKGRETEKAKE